MPIHLPPPVPLAHFATVKGAFTQSAPPSLGLIAEVGPLGQSGLEAPTQPNGIVSLVADGATAVFAASQRGMGVHGVNDAPNGGSNKPQFGCGVWGESTNGFGVFGSSDTAAGVVGTSKHGLAGQFLGNVAVTGTLTADNHTVKGTLTAFDVALAGGDCAEEFDVADLLSVEPGFVMVIDDDEALEPCSRAYDKRAAGIVSGAGSYRPGMLLDRRPGRDNRVPLALVGKVYCRVDSRYSAIEIGDLLTTSPTRGHAMKATDTGRAFGAVIGKALKAWSGGQGMIPVLVALQ